MPANERMLIWIGSSKKDLMALPLAVRKFFGHALDYAQRGDQHEAAKVLKGFGSAGVLELVDYDTAGTYRAIYTVRFAEAVFVLHCFQKKSKKGASTASSDMELVHARMQIAEQLALELRNEQTKN
jgi:phage-related protein